MHARPGRVGGGWRARRHRPCGRSGRGSPAARRSGRSSRPPAGCVGLPNQGSMRIDLAARRPDLDARMAVPGERRVAIQSHASAPPGSMLQRRYTRAVPATQIAQNLAFINWTVLTGLALGTYAAVVLLRRRTTATPGYLRFTTMCALGFGVLAWISDGALPSALGRFAGRRRPGLGRPATGRPAAVLRAGRGRSRRPARRPAGRAGSIEAGALAAAVATLVFGALAWGDGSLGRSALLVQLAVVSAAIGGVFAAMILGHWYLVTPKLPGGAAHPAGAGPARRGRRPGRPVLGLDRDRRRSGRRRRRSRRWSGRGRCSSGCA